MSLSTVPPTASRPLSLTVTQTQTHHSQTARAHSSSTQHGSGPMLCANENLPRKGQVRTDPTMRWSVIHTHLYSHRTRLCQEARSSTSSPSASLSPSSSLTPPAPATCSAPCPLPPAPCMLWLAKACRSAAATRRRCGRMSQRLFTPPTSRETGTCLLWNSSGTGVWHPWECLPCFAAQLAKCP